MCVRFIVNETFRCAVTFRTHSCAHATHLTKTLTFSIGAGDYYQSFVFVWLFGPVTWSGFQKNQWPRCHWCDIHPQFSVDEYYRELKAVCVWFGKASALSIINIYIYILIFCNDFCNLIRRCIMADIGSR